MSKAESFRQLLSQDQAKIYHHDLVGEQPIPHFFCQNCGKELVILWSPDKTAENEYRAIGIVCPTCFNPKEFESYFEQQDAKKEGDYY